MMFLLVFLVHITQVPTAHSWSGNTHQFVAQEAIDIMPNDLDWFFSTYSSTISIYSAMPDSWKNSDPNEDYRHYYDYDRYSTHTYTEPQQPANGVLPWALYDNFNTFVQLLRDQDWTHAAQLAGVICHYTGDSTMPLHATSDFWLGGAHSTYEIEVSNRTNDITISSYVPQQLGNVFDATMATLRDSYGFTDSTHTDHTKLSYWLLQSQPFWNYPTVQNITENRLNAAVQFTANVWYTAMVQAGLVSLSSVDVITPYWENLIPFEITATAGASAQSVSLYYRYSTDNSSWGDNTFFENDNSSPYSWSFTAPQGDGYYEFYSIAREGDNEESPPDVADARCGVDNGAPGTPTKLSPADGTEENENTPTFTWSATTDNLSGVAKYELWVDDNPDFASPEVLENTTDNTTLELISPALANDNYWWRVRAWDRAGNKSNFETPWTLSVAIIRNVEVTISPTENTGMPGENVAFTVTVINRGNVSDNYSLTVGDNAGWSPSLSPTSLTVPAGENRTTKLTVNIPTNATGCTWDNIWVKATSQTDNMVENEDRCIAHDVGVPGCVKVLIDPTSKSGEPGGKLTYTVTVTNLGSAADTFTVEVTNTENWAPTVSPTSFSLNAGGSRNVGLSITIPSTAADGDSTTITVTAAGTGYENSATCTATAQAAVGGVSPFVYVGAAVVVVVMIIVVVLIVKPF
jgi:uncharacterized membrane protein